MKNRSTKSLWVILVVLGFMVSIVLLILDLLPFETVRKLADALSRDGSMEAFSRQAFQRYSPYALAAGVVIFLAAAATVVFRSRTLSLVDRFVGFLGYQSIGLASDTRVFFKRLKSNLPVRFTVIALLLLTAAAAVLRWFFINRFFMHDEAYTYIAFASRPLIKVVTDYHLPNNHVFHTILVHFSTLWFGNAAWAVRLPAFLSGVLMVPAAFVLARRFYNWNTALLSSALVAAAPVLINYSTNARGYTTLALITLLLWSLGTYLKGHKDRFAWLLFSVLAAVGFYTLPVMLYPYGIILTWMILSNLSGDRGNDYQDRWSMIRHLLFSGLVTVVLTLVLFLPIFIYSGINSVFNNPFVEPLPWGDFQQTLPIRLQETWEDWSVNIPVLGWAFLMAGVVFSLTFHRWICLQRVSLQVSSLVWIILLLIVQRPNAWGKIWTYLYAPLMIWASAGLLALLKDLSVWRWKAPTFQAVIALGALVLALLNGGLYALLVAPNVTEVKEVERSVTYLKEHIKEGEIIVISPPNDAAFWYYAKRQQLPENTYFSYKDFEYTRGYVLVSPNYDQTIESVLKERGPGKYPCVVTDPIPLVKIDETYIYACTRK